MKLVESKPNIIAGTSYAHLKECLIKIEKSGYLNNIVKHVDKEVSTYNLIYYYCLNYMFDYYNTLHLR